MNNSYFHRKKRIVNRNSWHYKARNIGGLAA